MPSSLKAEAAAEDLAAIIGLKVQTLDRVRVDIEREESDLAERPIGSAENKLAAEQRLAGRAARRDLLGHQRGDRVVYGDVVVVGRHAETGHEARRQHEPGRIGSGDLRLEIGVAGAEGEDRHVLAGPGIDADPDVATPVLNSSLRIGARISRETVRGIEYRARSGW